MTEQRGTLHGYTTHGHACCSAGEWVEPRPTAVARCMGPPACPVCRSQVTEIHAENCRTCPRTAGNIDAVPGACCHDTT